MEHRLPPEQYKQIQDTFRMFDDNDSGSISRAEFGEALRSTGLNPTEEELKAMVREMDIDKDGKISFEEFLLQHVRMIEEAGGKDEVADLREAFRILDRDGSGSVSLFQLRTMLTTRGDMLTTDEVDTVLRLAETDSRGELDFEGFVKLMKS